jgi:hypothetical protein
MKWLLVDKNDNINSTCEIGAGFGERGAKAYFMGRKRSSSTNPNSKWWKDDDKYLDIDR